MVGINGTNIASAYPTYAANGADKTTDKKTTDKKAADKKTDAKKEAAKAGTAETGKTTKSAEYGRTVGDPQLSEKAKKYYDQLKKKYGNYDFVLVSEDQKENAKANAAKYANKVKTVVLIDEDKIERMASDESYRKKYEGVLSGATAQLTQLKSSMEQSGANVQGYGMQVNEGGTASFFAVLKKSSSDQKARIEKKAAEKKAEKKDAEKKAEKKAAEKKAQEKRTEKLKSEKAKSEQIDDDRWLEDDDDSDTIVITANSVEELMKKISDYTFTERSDNIQTESEKMVGQHIDFRG